jgi:hypothetical protein
MFAHFVKESIGDGPDASPDAHSYKDCASFAVADAECWLHCDKGNDTKCPTKLPRVLVFFTGFSCTNFSKLYNAAGDA